MAAHDYDRRGDVLICRGCGVDLTDLEQLHGPEPGKVAYLQRDCPTPAPPREPSIDDTFDEGEIDERTELDELRAEVSRLRARPSTRARRPRRRIRR